MRFLTDVVVALLLITYTQGFLTDSNVLAKPCPDGWTHNADKCYLIVTNKLTWMDAQVYCSMHNSQLVEIASSSENTFVKSHLPRGEHYWMGASDITSEGVFTWTHSGKKFSNTYTDWHSPEPNEGNYANCVIFWNAVGFQWADENCYKQYGFVCEKYNHE
uniref:C-type lectin domain-containing protein n=1 Tax=Pinctada fucata TaxID=50426 RepID=A0A194AKZ4_PINFU